jgi:DNA-binding MarR family transcriptional regulator
MMTSPTIQPPAPAESDPVDASPALDVLASKLHSAAIHILRRVRREDVHSGLTAPRASALSVIVFGGPVTLGDLAAAEQVRPPTITRIVRALEEQHLVTRVPDRHDRRVVRLRATKRGERLLLAARDRRVQRLTEAIDRLPARDRQALAGAVAILERIARDA